MDMKMTFLEKGPDYSLERKVKWAMQWGLRLGAQWG